MFRRLIPQLWFSLSILAVGTVCAQVQSIPQTFPENTSGSIWITATAGKEQVRFASLGIVQRMRLQILNQIGDRIFDSNFSSGSLLDWKIEDGEGRRLPDGLYGCLVTVEDFAGQSSSRRAAFWLKDGVILFGNSERSKLEATAGEEQDSLTILRGDEALPITHLAHDGKAGRIVSGRGGLSFRVGDLFAGKDIEYMRLTADGKLGVGVEEPAAKLDVAGLIRTSEGIVFPDGTIQRTAANPFALGAVVNESATALGAGTSGRSLSRGILAGGDSASDRPSASGSFKLNALKKPGLPPLALTTGDQSFTGRLCFGQDCVDPETWSVSSGENVRLKQNNNRLTFIDTSAGGFPQGDWQLRLNNNTGSSNYFAIDWLGTTATTATETPVSTPLLIEGAAPGNSLYVQQSGNVGIGTATPSSSLSVVRNADFDPSLTHNSAALFNLQNGLTDLVFTNDQSLPFAASIQHRHSVLDGYSYPIALNPLGGRVGIGTSNPGAKLNVTGGDVLVDTNQYYKSGSYVSFGSAADYAAYDGYWGHKFKVLGNERVRIDPSGNVGIGTTSPGAKLNVAGGDVLIDTFQYYRSGPYVSFGSAADYAAYDGFWGHKFKVGGAEKARIDVNGNVGIGTTGPTERLHVIGNLRVSGSILYGAGEEPVPDYVFEPGYKLMSVEELQQFLEREKHLPNMPNAADIKGNGLNLSQFQMKLLEKIEELTLYIVEQAKANRVQQTAIERKNTEISLLNARLLALEQMMERLVRQESQEQKH